MTRVDWTCRHCGLPLVGVVLPIRHDCRPARRLLDRLAECVYRGPLIETRRCNSCGDRGKRIDVFACDVHGSAYVAESGTLPGVASCRYCCLADDGFRLPDDPAAT